MKKKVTFTMAEDVAKKEAAPGKAGLSGLFGRLRLHFKVDPQTQEVTMFVVDQTSQQVIRTIPSGELAKPPKDTPSERSR